MRKIMLTSVALLGLVGTATAQTAGGPATASPGAMPSNTPLTSNGAVRTGAATPATPAAIGANKPAKPAAVRTRRTTTHKATPAASQ